MTKFTNRQKADCAKREVKQRMRVYPRWVAEHRMKQSFADEQIAMMQEIADEYEAKATEEEAKERLI